MLKLEDAQLDFHSQILEKLLREDHPYRKISELFKRVNEQLRAICSSGKS